MNMARPAGETRFADLALPRQKLNDQGPHLEREL